MTTRANTSNRPPTVWQQLKDRSLSVEAIRQVDRTAIDRFHMHSLVLMENAAIGCAQWLTAQYPAAAGAAILCGRGNNGGDGLAIARHLRLAGWKCHVIQLGPLEKLSPDARCNWDVLCAKGMSDCLLIDDTGTEQIGEVSAILSQVDVIIDALLGSGAQGAPRAPMAEFINLANASSAPRVAIDIPSGLDATTGQPATPTFRAQATLTFVARKMGFDAPTAQDVLGHVEVLPIGIPVELVEELLLLPQ